MNVKQANEIVKNYLRDLELNGVASVNSVKLEKAFNTLTRFVDVVTGEPSQEMIDATITSYNENGQIALVSHAKAYIKQAEREVVAK